ncbi:hypothetical protein FOZ61_001480 [Perkinsus olseni]|uniref:Uncharacterized protein n=1 Tax=Perkinsus olseni TaxID=32597 RepID=A0A7J6LWI4_PEROL|nr:hypothetical protein FOZ61_001480 [Perkinsus olseni]
MSPAHFPDDNEYSDKYTDDTYEYRHVILSKPTYRMLQRSVRGYSASTLLDENQWRSVAEHIGAVGPGQAGGSAEGLASALPAEQVRDFLRAHQTLPFDWSLPPPSTPHSQAVGVMHVRSLLAALLAVAAAAAAASDDRTVVDLSHDPWIVTPMLAGGQYGLPEEAVDVQDSPGDLELTLRKLEREVDATALREDETFDRDEYAQAEPDLCGRAFEHLFKRSPAWETARERVNSVVNEIFSALDQGGGKVGPCYSILGLLLSSASVDGRTGEALVSDEQLQRILLLVQDLGGDVERRRLPPSVRLYRKGADMGCSMGEEREEGFRIRRGSLGSLALVSSTRLGYPAAGSSVVSLATQQPPAVVAVLNGESEGSEGGGEECMEMAALVVPILEAVVGNIGWDRLRVLNDADSRSVYLEPGKPAPDDDVSMFYSWVELLPHSQWSNLQNYLTQEQIDELTAFLSDEEGVAAGVAKGQSALDNMKEGPAEVHASIQELRYNIVAEKLRPALEAVGGHNESAMACEDALDRILAVVMRYHRSLRILDGMSHTHPSEDIKLLAAMFASEMGTKSGHVNAAQLITERQKNGLPLAPLRRRGKSWPLELRLFSRVPLPLELIAGDAAEGDGGYLKNSKVAGWEAECVQGCRANPSCEYAVYYPDSGYCKWSEDCSRLLRTKQHDTRLWRRVEQGMAAQQESLRPENFRMRAAVGAHDAYSVRVLVAEYRASGSSEGTALAYQWASFGADTLGDYQCMYERAMMDAVDRKDYALAVGRLLNLSRLPAVVFPWEVNPLDQFADPELETKVMDMLIENNPWAAAAADLGGVSDEEELQEMGRPGTAAAAPPPHVTASMLGIVAAFVAYAADCCRCGLRALRDVRQHTLLSAFQVECPFIRAPEGWPSPVMVQLAVIVLVFVPVLLSFTILSRKLLRRMVIQGVPEAPDHQHQE